MADQANPATNSRASGTPARSVSSTAIADEASQAAQTIGSIRASADRDYDPDQPGASSDRGPRLASGGADRHEARTERPGHDQIGERSPPLDRPSEDGLEEGEPCQEHPGQAGPSLEEPDEPRCVQHEDWQREHRE
jgi:hypothetical protein